MVSVPSSERRVAPFISVRHCRCSDLSRELLCGLNSYTMPVFSHSSMVLISRQNTSPVDSDCVKAALAYVTHRQSHVVHVSTIAPVAYLSPCYIRIRK